MLQTELCLKAELRIYYEFHVTLPEAEETIPLSVISNSF